MYSSAIEKLWCYSCEKESHSERLYTECSYCGSDAIEYLPRSNANVFQAYYINPQGDQSTRTDSMSNHTILWTNNGPAVTITNELGNFNSVQATFQNHMVDIGNYLINRLLTFTTGLIQNRPAVTPYQIARLKSVAKVYECSICQQQGEEDDTGYELKCGHVYHKQCLRNWLTTAATCPMCRAKVE